jgi:hypothetical protein
VVESTGDDGRASCGLLASACGSLPSEALILLGSPLPHVYIRIITNQL